MYKPERMLQDTLQPLTLPSLPVYDVETDPLREKGEDTL